MTYLTNACSRPCCATTSEPSWKRSSQPFLPAKPMSRTWHIEAIAWQLERVRRGEIRRLIINMPPRSLKSIAASVAFPAFVLGHDPSDASSASAIPATLPKSTPTTSALCSNRAGIDRLSRDADWAVQELGNRDRAHGARLPPGDFGRRHADRSRRRHHRHRRSAQAGRRLVGDQAVGGQPVVHEHAAVAPRQFPSKWNREFF